MTPLREPTADLLTDREREVLELVATGLTDKEIARDLGTSVNTVRSQVVSARQKLGASSRAQAVAIIAKADA